MASRNAITKLLSLKPCNYFTIRQTFCTATAALQIETEDEALFEVHQEYKYANFRHAISCADGVETIQKTMGTIKHINTQKNNKFVHATIYSAALKRAHELNEFKECWRLYNEAKHASQIDIYLLTQMINITSSFVETQFMFDYDNKNSRMYNKSKSEVAKHKMLCRIHQLYSEMKYEFKLQPTHATYASLINACTKFKSFLGAQKYWDIYCSDKNLTPKSIDVYSAIMYSKVNKGDMIGAMKYFNEMINRHKIEPNGHIISKLLSGFAHRILMRKKNYSKFMEISDLMRDSEDLMKLYLQKCVSESVYVGIEVWNAMCNVYASNGDVTSCFDILHCLLDQRLPHSYAMKGEISIDVPLPNVYTLNTCLKSLVYCTDLHKNAKDSGNVWRLVAFVLSKMKECEIGRDCTTFATLFHLCGNEMNGGQSKPDLDKAIAFYLELSTSENIKTVSKKCMYSLLMTGLQFYDYCKRDASETQQTQSKCEFIEWWLLEAKDHRVQCSLSIEQLVNVNAKKFRIPK